MTSQKGEEVEGFQELIEQINNVVCRIEKLFQLIFGQQLRLERRLTSGCSRTNSKALHSIYELQNILTYILSMPLCLRSYLTSCLSLVLNPGFICNTAKVVEL